MTVVADTLKQVEAGALNVGYAEAGPAGGPTALLLHGWPYDIHAYDDVAALLAARGYRSITPYLRGYGTTRFLSDDTLRNGQQAVLAVDAIALMDALDIENAIVAGFDWGARTADIVAALWPDRCRGLVSVSGYLIGSQGPAGSPFPPRPSGSGGTSTTSPPSAAAPATSRYRREFAKLIWRTASPRVALRRRDLRPDRGVVRQPGSRGHRDPQLPVAARPGRGRAPVRRARRRLAEAPNITVPAITLEGDANGAPHPDPAAYADKFSGEYSHRTIEGGIGHNLPQEAPQAFVDAVLDVDPH